MEARAPSQASYLVSWSKVEERFNLLAVDVTLDWASKHLSEFLAFGHRLAGLTRAVFGTISVLMPQTQLLNPFDLRTRLPFPDYWIILFGNDYVQLFGLERLLSSPCHRAEVLPSGHVQITMTPTPTDQGNPGLAKDLREHLGQDAFMDPGKSYLKYKTGTAPTFDFSEILTERPFPPKY